MKSSLFVCASSIALFALASATSLQAADTASAADKTFVGKVSQGGMYEVEASKLAQQRAHAQDVKDLADTEVHDHEGVNGKLKAIAAPSGVPIAAQLNPMFQQRLDTLKAVPAQSFDAAYLSDMQSIHAKDEKLFAQESMEGSGKFKPFAAETDIIVKRHIGALNAK